MKTINYSLKLTEKNLVDVDSRIAERLLQDELVAVVNSKLAGIFKNILDQDEPEGIVHVLGQNGYQYTDYNNVIFVVLEDGRMFLTKPTV